MLKLKKNKGITLIALVITIIILLILAGITIGQLTNSGLFSKVQLAKEQYSLETAKEQLEIEIMNLKMQKGLGENNVTLDDLKAYLEDSKFNGEYLVELFYEPLAATEPTSTTPLYAKVTHVPTKFVFYVDGKLVVIGEESSKTIADASRDNDGKAFTVYFNGEEINYFPEITNNVKLISATATNGAKIELDENDSSFKISNLSSTNTNFQLKYMTINDYRKLMTLAGINANYNSMSELISNASALEKILDSTEATQYLVMSPELLSAIANSEAAMQNIAGSEKLMYKAIINDSIRSVILNSSYISAIDSASVKVPTLSDNNNGKIIASSCMSGYNVWNCFDGNNSSVWRCVHGESFSNTYIGYNFGENLICYKVEIILTNGGYANKTRQAVFESSMDGNTWSSLMDNFSITTSSNEIYTYTPTNINVGKYFRFKGVSGDTLQEIYKYAHDIAYLQFYCVKVVNN